MASFRTTLGIQEVTDKKSNLARALLAEFLGTLFLNFFGCGAVMNGGDQTLTISVSFGLAVAAAVQFMGHVSGGHVNPAVTCGMLAIGKIPVIRAILYVVAQSAGAIAGSAILRAVTASGKQALLGAVKLNNDTEPVQGFVVELIMALILVLVVCGATDPGKPESKPLAPLIIGLTVTMCHIIGIPRTSTGMNPARALGAAVIEGVFDDHWLYWVGPILGGVAGALIYTHAIGPAKETESSRSYATVATEEKERFEYIDSGRGGL
ncbi:aquaporin-like isoform X2 [Phymastichus coffea]|uniref:aquaporin-like isoform X2 n=1 Tax=Phymastichus coffea TaxID=108790 RepID=UPI00273BF6A7|nr:aquaporin-like isoform X2 [Phymastichus coffea]